MKLLWKAFTLIELLIIIVIIGVLATALIPRVKGMQEKAKYTRLEKDFQDFRTVVFMAQSNTGKPLKDITWSACTGCYCYPLDNTNHLPSKPENDICRTSRILALRKIEVAAGMNSGALSNMNKDPWWAPYVLDENEWEHGSNGCLYFDSLGSAGTNGYRWWLGYRGLSIAPQWCPGSY